jgi:hypothetical protein
MCCFQGIPDNPGELVGGSTRFFTAKMQRTQSVAKKNDDFTRFSAACINPPKGEKHVRDNPSFPLRLCGEVSWFIRHVGQENQGALLFVPVVQVANRSAGKACRSAGSGSC